MSKKFDAALTLAAVTSDGTISDVVLREAYRAAMKMDWQDGWYSTPEMKKEAKTPGYKHIHLGGSDTEEVEYEIEQDWVKEIWDKVDPEGVKLLRHYLNCLLYTSDAADE